MISTKFVFFFPATSAQEKHIKEIINGIRKTPAREISTETEGMK